jgi:hypothetical protein
MKRIIKPVVISMLTVFLLVYFAWLFGFFLRPAESEMQDLFNEHKNSFVQLKNLIQDRYAKTEEFNNNKTATGVFTYTSNTVYISGDIGMNISFDQPMFNSIMDFKKKQGKTLDFIDANNTSVKFIFNQGMILIIYQDILLPPQELISNGDRLEYYIYELGEKWYYAIRKEWGFIFGI